MSNLGVEEVDKKLSEISDSFCAAKWSQVLFNLQVGERHNCCLAIPHKINAALIKEDTKYLFNDDKLVLERKEMLEGKKISSCRICWRAEENGYHSDRHFKSSADWSEPFMDKKNLTLDNVVPTYVEVSFGNKCQMMCTYCSPNNSSSLARESKKFGGYKLSVDQNRMSKELENTFLDENENHVYAKAFWDWFLENNQTFRVLRFTGGEPLISKWMDKFLDWLTDNSIPQADLAFNSNLSIPVEVMQKFIQKLKLIPRSHYKSIQFFTSLDGWGPGAELARYGLKLETFEKNLELLIQNFPDSLFRVTATLNIFAFPDIKKLFEKMYEYKQRSRYHDQFAIVCYPLLYPDFMSIGWMGKYYRKYYEETMEYIETHMYGGGDKYGFFDFEKDYFKKATSFEGKFQIEKHSIDIFLYINQFLLRKNLTEYNWPREVMEVYEQGKNYILNIDLNLFSASVWAKAERWIDSESRIQEIHAYIIEQIESGSQNLWEIFGVRLDFIHYYEGNEWPESWFKKEKGRIGGFEMLSRMCHTNPEVNEPKFKGKIIKYLADFTDPFIDHLKTTSLFKNVKWSEIEKERLLLLLNLPLSDKQKDLIQMIKNT